jgi:hypothetical protein
LTKVIIRIIHWLFLVKKRIFALIKNFKPIIFEKLDASCSQLEIYLKEPTPTLVRDFLIYLNFYTNQEKLQDRKIDRVSICINPDRQFDNLGEICSCISLFSLAADIDFNWSHEVFSRSEAIKNTGKEEDVFPIQGFSIYSHGLHKPDFRLDDYFQTCGYNLLTVTANRRAWAHNFLTKFHPGTLIICFHIPKGSERDEPDLIFENWAPFFQKMKDDFPRVHFLLLNRVEDGVGKSLSCFHNVTSTKAIGLDFLEEIALVKTCDLYIGTYGKYAISVIGTETPFVLFETNIEGPRCGDESRKDQHQNQIYLRELISPESFLNNFDQFVERIGFGKRA